MDHKAIKEKLFDLYDGELEAVAREEVQTHLAGCLECRELYDGWANTAQLFFQAPKPEPSEFFIRGVMNRIHELETPKPARDWSLAFRWLVPAIGFALVFFALMPSAPPALSMDTLLFQEANGYLSWALSNKAPTPDETLQFVMEG